MVMGVGLLILGILLMAVLISHPGSSPASSNSAAIESPAATDTSAIERPQEISVSAPKLWVDYNANEVAADNIYKGKRLIVQGQVMSIKKNFIDQVYVSLTTLNEFESVHANIKEEYKSEAAMLHIGQIITVECEGGGMIVGSPILKECSMQPNVPPVQSLPQSEPQPQVLPISSTSTPVAPPSTVDLTTQPKETTMPVLIQQAPAEYSEEARRNRLQGAVQVVLLVDENGIPQNITVVRSLGMGLDESAVEAVKQYKFKPAIDQTGKPIPAQISVNVQFHLY
jgi:TonB family protein